MEFAETSPFNVETPFMYNLPFTDKSEPRNNLEFAETSLFKTDNPATDNLLLSDASCPTSNLPFNEASSFTYNLEFIDTSESKKNVDCPVTALTIAAFT